MIRERCCVRLFRVYHDTILTYAENLLRVESRMRLLIDVGQEGESAGEGREWGVCCEQGRVLWNGEWRVGSRG